MVLSREELLFFHGHTELYCRADRKGLVHVLDPGHKARFGYTYDTWMAAVGRNAYPVVVAQAAKISRGLLDQAARQRAAARQR